MDKKGFTLIEMLVTTIILVIVFGLLAVIFSRATVIHKVVRSGGDSENLGIYLMNTITYGHGINREESLIGSRPFPVILPNYTASSTFTDSDLQFTDTNGRTVRYVLTDGTLKHAPDPSNLNNFVDLKPTWAKDRQLNVLTDRDTTTKHLLYSEFSYYDTTLIRMVNPPATAQYPGYVGIKLVLLNTLQNTQEAVTLYQCVRIRNQIDF